MSDEIAAYWYWHLERWKYAGLILQLGGVLLFFSVWWLKNSGWAKIRPFLIMFFLAIGILRYGVWLFYGIFNESTVQPLSGFIPRSGLSGLIVCITAFVLLVKDRKSGTVVLDHFGPEDWEAERPSFRQWLGVIIMMFSIWSPFVPYPLTFMNAGFTYGFPTSFGITITPMLTFLGGLFLAGERREYRPLMVTGILTVISSLFSEPFTLLSLTTALLGTVFILRAYVVKKSIRNTEKKQSTLTHDRIEC